MSGFTGFSEVDIKKVQNGENPVNKKPQTITQNKQSNFIKPKKISSENRNKNLLNEKLKVTNGQISLPEEAKLNSAVVTKVLKGEEQEGKGGIVEENEKESVEIIEKNSNEGNKSVEVEEDKMNPSQKDMLDFQTKQKLMEEQNRIRKEMLSKALAVRTKQTLEEQQRLNEIRAEFKKIDDSLSNDVKILRKQIETASLEYMEAQKQFDKKEKEYLQAKVYLHSKLEQKELLTEHLQTIIEKNEERKAKKLTELLQKLDCLQNEDTDKLTENVKPQVP